MVDNAVGHKRDFLSTLQKGLAKEAVTPFQKGLVKVDSKGSNFVHADSQIAGINESGRSHKSIAMRTEMSDVARTKLKQSGKKIAGIVIILHTLKRGGIGHSRKRCIQFRNPISMGDGIVVRKDKGICAAKAKCCIAAAIDPDLIVLLHADRQSCFERFGYFLGSVAGCVVDDQDFVGPPLERAKAFERFGQKSGPVSRNNGYRYG